MAEELQGLLERIHRDGIKKAETEKDAILATARDEAKKIIDDATKQAAELKKKAEEDAVASEARAKSAIQQAARDVILSLRSDLQLRLSNVVKACSGDAMTPDFMGKIIQEMAKSYKEKSGAASVGVEVLVNKNDAAEIEKRVMGSLLKDLQEKPEISIAQDFGHGLKIGFKGSEVFLDFSDDAISEMICQYIGPKLSKLVSGK